MPGKIDIIKASISIKLISAALFLCVLSACKFEQESANSRPGNSKDQSQIRAVNLYGGKLTAAQIESYIDIRREVIEIKQRYRTETDEFANGTKVFKNSHYQEQILRQAGMHNDEYQWIQEKIIEASTRLMLTQVYDLNESIIQKLISLLQFNQKRLKKIADVSERNLLLQHNQEIELQLAEFQQEHRDRIQLSEALRHNVSLVQKRMSDLSEIKLVSGSLAGPSRQ